MSSETSSGSAVVTSAHLNAVIRRAAGAHRSLTSERLRRAGVSIGQELLMLELAGHQPCSQSELASAAGCEPSTITISVRKLEAAGLVRRSPSTSDARAMSVSLTPEGEAVIPHLEAAQAEIARRVVEALPPGMGAADFVALLERVTVALEARSGND